MRVDVSVTVTPTNFREAKVLYFPMLMRPRKLEHGLGKSQARMHQVQPRSSRYICAGRAMPFSWFKTHWRAFLIGVALVMPGLFVTELKPLPQGILVAFLALVAGLTFLRTRPGPGMVLGRLALSAAGWSGLWVAIYGIAVWIAPPVTSDGHPVMPMGQVFLAFIGSTVVGALLGIFYLRSKRQDVAVEAAIVRILAGTALVSALFSQLS